MAIDQVDSARKWAVISQQIANPAAGSDFVGTVPTGSIWRVRCVFAKLTTSATVANRTPQLQIKDASGNVLVFVPCNSSAVQAASQNNVPHVWFENAVDLLQNGATDHILPANLTLAEGWTIGPNTLGIQTGDQWSAISLIVEQAEAL